VYRAIIAGIVLTRRRLKPSAEQVEHPYVEAHHFRILLVEDNVGDAELMRLALAQAEPRCDLRVASDGEEALGLLLHGELPDLLLLDLNLPRLTGHEVLADLRAAREPRLRRLPVVVLTSSSTPEDVQRSYDLFASSHIVKPQDVDQLFEVAERLAQYWFGTVSLP
jgi:two-component system, chemotaxis family, response regulator Rcp1